MPKATNIKPSSIKWMQRSQELSAAQTLADAVLAFWIFDGRTIPGPPIIDIPEIRAMHEALVEYERVKEKNEIT